MFELKTACIWGAVIVAVLVLLYVLFKGSNAVERFLPGLTQPTPLAQALVAKAYREDPRVTDMRRRKENLYAVNENPALTTILRN